MSEAEVNSGTCATCHAPASLKCSGCSSVFYCGKEHQKQDWVQHKTQCRAFEISTSTELGRHLVACRDIKEGEIILTEDPFVLAPQRVVEYPTCIGCCVKLSPTSKTVCPGCTWPACDEKCPKLKDPAFHGRQECTMLSFEASRNRYDWEVVLPLRVLVMHLKNQNPKMSKWIKERGPFAVARQIDRYMDEIVGGMGSSLSWISTLLATNSSSSIVRTAKQIVAVIESCALDLVAPRDGCLRGLYPNASLMQHSCAPTTRLLFDKPGSTSSVAERKDSYAVGRITVKAVRNIRKGEDLSWTCTRQSDTTSTRQTYLAATRNMRCFCERCKDPTEFGSNLDTWKCHLCSGWLNLATTLLPEVKFKCNKCGIISDHPVDCGVVSQFVSEVKDALMSKKREPIVHRIARFEQLLINAENYMHPDNRVRLFLKLEGILYTFGHLTHVNGVEGVTKESLQKIRELGREVLGTMEKFGNCFFRDEALMSICLLILTEAETEIMKRNFKSGKWSRDETMIALEKCRNNLRRALELENFVQQFPLRHNWIELITMRMTELDTWATNLLEKNKESNHRCVTCKKPASLECTGCRSVYYCDKKHQKKDWSDHKGWGRGFEVRTTVELGPHLIAIRDFKKDDRILAETPFLVGPPLFENDSDICVGCCRSLDPVTKAVCPRCKWPICNSRCPGLIGHAAECEILSGHIQLIFQFEFLLKIINKVLLALRCLILQKINPEKWKWIEMMFPFAESKIVNPLLRMNEASLLSSLVRHRDLGLESLQQVLAVLDVYSVFGGGYGKTRAVSALSTNTSLLQQSCCPNTQVLYADPPENSDVMTGRFTVIALKDISKGEVLTCMWTHQLSMNLRRQSELRNMKNIKCSCPRCLDPRELGTDFSTLKCTLCSGWVVAIQPCSELVDWKCLSCGVIMSAKEVEDRLNYLNKEMEELVNLDRAGRAVDISQVTLLQSLLNTYLHPNHELCFTLKTVMMRHIGNSPGLAGIPKLSDGDLETKAELCRQLIESAEKLGISYSRSETLFASFLATFAKSRAEMVKRKFARQEVTKEEAVKTASESRALLLRALFLVTLNHVLDADEFGEAASKQYVSEDQAILSWANENGLKLAVQ